MFISERLSEFLSSDFALPKALVQRAQELMLDAYGTAIAGANGAEISALAKALGASSIAQDGQVLLWGRNDFATPLHAAMINAASAHALDFDDTLTEAILHASAPLAPLCLCYATAPSACANSDAALPVFSQAFERLGDLSAQTAMHERFARENPALLALGSQKVLRAFIAGWEVAARVGIASRGGFHENGFHTTAICAVFGTAAAACVLKGLNASQMCAALGFAASFAGGINEFLSNGSNSKILHVAQAVANGVKAADYAAAGLCAPLSVFEGRDNIFRAFAKREGDLNAMLQGLGEDFMIMQVSLKPYPCCHFAHGLIDCAKSLRNDGVKAEQIEEILCYIDAVPEAFICDPLEKKLAPQSAYEVKFSFAYLLALMLLDGQITLQNIADFKRANVAQLAAKMRYERYKSEGFPRYFCGKLRARLTNGREVEKEVKINRGNPQNPLSSEEIIEKFTANLRYASANA